MWGFASINKYLKSVIYAYCVIKIIRNFQIWRPYGGFKFGSVLCIGKKIGKVCDLRMVIFGAREMLYEQIYEHTFYLNWGWIVMLHINAYQVGTPSVFGLWNLYPMH